MKCYLEVTSASADLAYSADDPNKIVALLTVQSLSSPSAYGYEKASLFSSICLENKRMFAELNGLHFVVGTPGNAESEISPRLLKIKWILELFKQGYERVLYMDLDTLILDPSVNMMSVVQSFNHTLGVALDYNYFTSKKMHRSRVRGHAKDTRDVRRYNTGVMVIRNSRESVDFFGKIYDEGAKSGMDVSDQVLFNRYIHEYIKERSLYVFERSIFNAFPSISDTRFRAMHPSLPIGDERNSSLIVHFAGVFGGSTEEEGEADPLALLLVYKELLERHNEFITKFSESHMLVLGIDKTFIANKYSGARAVLKECIDSIFQDVDFERAEKKSRACLEESTEKTLTMATKKARHSD